MIHVDLDDSEKQILLETLESYLGNLSYEIADTDLMEYRDQLKARRAVLQKIVESIRAPQEPKQ